MRYKRAPLPCNAVSKMPFILLFLFISSFLLGASSIWWRGYRETQDKRRKGNISKCSQRYETPEVYEEREKK